MAYGVYSFVVTDRARTGSELVALTVVFPSVQIHEFFSSQIGCGDFVASISRTLRDCLHIYSDFGGDDFSGHSLSSTLVLCRGIYPQYLLCYS